VIFDFLIFFQKILFEGAGGGGGGSGSAGV
jgi:hypothetical protein